ncbi:MAG: nucleoside-diphosphate kinase [Candidatus Omnitrophica bacterium]|nr:nucleoside-diphosphate kinase [Candidatus Omnitrophota bacterium]
MADEATLVLIKPDAIARGLTGAVLTRLDQLGLRVVGAKALRVSRRLATEHYQALRGRPFFEGLVTHLTGQLHGVDYVLAFVYAGPDAIAKVRQAAGATDPEQADPASLRGAFGRNTAGVMENILHASSDAREAEREIALWFRPDELLSPQQAAKRATTQPAGVPCCRA